MIKLLSIASGKTTAEQEAEAGSIPYSQYIKQKESEQNKNTAENDGVEVENLVEISVEEKILNIFGITKLNDTLHVQKKVLETLEHDGFWENEENSTTVVNDDSEMKIVINESGIEETISYKHFTKLPKDLKIKKLITVMFLPQIIQKGVVISDDVENYHDKNSSIKYTYIDCIVEIDGEPSVVTVAIRKSPQKNKFWVHQVDINKNVGSTPTGTSESSKTGYLTSDNTVIISSDDIVVNKNISDDMFTDSFSDEKRAKKRERGETLAEKLGLKLSWSSEVTEGKYNPKTREVTLNPNLTAGRIYMFIFKHEFVHDLENRKGYKSFKNYLFNSSKTFVDYCETELLNKYGIQESGKNAVAVLTGKVYDAWTTSEELSENEKAAFDNEAAEREIVCNYVADRLLGGLREGGDYEQESYDALVELADTHRNIFQRFVDWVKDIINMIKGEPTFNDMADELQYLNERLAKVYDSRINFQNMTEFGFKHNISKNVDNVSFKEDRYFQSLVNRWQTLTHGAFVKVGKINENHPLVKVGMPSGELRYDVSKLKKNMSDHSDYLDKKLLLAIPEIIAEPIAITQYSQSNTVSVFGNCFVGKSPMMVGITISKDRAGNDITKVRTYNARRDVANLISDESILYLCENKKRTQKWFQACGIQVPLGETKFGFIRSITQSFEKIKDNSDISNSHSIAAPINEETKANNRKKNADAFKKR